MKNRRTGSVPNLNYVQNRLLLITILINQHQILGRKNKNSYRPPEIKKGESPKSCSNCKRKDTLFQNVLEINNESISQDFIACNALKDLILSLCAKPLGGWKLVITSKVLRSQPRLGWPLWHICVTNDHGNVPRIWDNLTEKHEFWNYLEQLW